jgi:hypothetical protein
MWVEHSLIQPAKRHTKFRMVTAPERLLVSNLLCSDRLQSLLREFPGELEPVEAQCTKGGVPNTKDSDKFLDVLDEFDNEAGAKDILLGKPTKVLRSEIDIVKTLLGKLLEDFESLNAHWHPDLVAEYELTWFDRCCLRSYEIVHSSNYHRPTETKSMFCKVRFLEGDLEKQYVAKIQRFLKIKDPGSGRALRVADCSLYNAAAVEDYRGRCLRVVGQDVNPCYIGYPVLLEMLDHKVMYCNMTRASPNSFATAGWLFVPYSHTASSVDPRLE